eukprot:CAMPEP_0168323380 /NCGR_PEP_ID=MMETSP0213-20121227/3447_1 /TAXON_ID=151035 /ORGANISM="Euplotes harpa, Strain FSP1.4" /LENGTH=102 /DNA_ID=CAMNT_0008325441 /DNA_START=34 /DNA_END=339 /DNA_ORIENTATION=+
MTSFTSLLSMSSTEGRSAFSAKLEFLDRLSGVGDLTDQDKKNYKVLQEFAEVEEELECNEFGLEKSHFEGFVNFVNFRSEDGKTDGEPVGDIKRRIVKKFYF